MRTPLVLTILIVIVTYPVTGESQIAPPAAGEPHAAAAGLSAAELWELQKKADSGDVSAQFALGRAYETGNGVRTDPAQAAVWYRKAADQGNAKAQNSLGVAYWLGEGVEKDKTTAVQWYRKAARQGDSRAMFNLGAAYYNGEGVGLDDILAYAWFLLSTEAGDPNGPDAVTRSQKESRPWAQAEAFVKIGQMYEKGEDLPKNLDLAAAWYKKAAEQGNIFALIGLSSIYLNAHDFVQARQWCEAAAKRQLSGGDYS